MSSLLGTLSVVIQMGTVGTAKAIKDIRTVDRAAQATTSNIVMSSKNINSAVMSIGRTMTQFVTLPLGILQVTAAKTFSTFEYNLSKVTGLVGIAGEQTKQWGRQLLSLSRDVGKGAGDLSDALYFVTTGGVRGAETMDVLATSAKLAATGLGDTKTVADLVVSAMNAYGKSSLSAAQAGDILIRSVREGKAEADQLVKSMGVVFPIASQLGVSFGEVGAGMAAMTRTGTTAATSATQLRRILFGMLKPAQGAEAAMNLMGTSSEELRKSLGEDGLLNTLLKLKDMMDVFGEETLAKAFPNIRALAGILDILGPNLEENRKVFDSIANSGGDLALAFDNVSETFKFKVNATMAQGSVLLTKYGEILSKFLIPIFENVADRLENAGRWFDNLSNSQKKLFVSTTAIITVLGPLIAIGSALYSMISGIGAVFGFTSTAMAKNTAAIQAQTAALAQQTAAQAAQTASEVQSLTVKGELIVSTRTLAKLEQEEALTASMLAKARVLQTAATTKMGAAQWKLTIAKRESEAAAYRLAIAENTYETRLKSGLGTKTAYAALLKAEKAHKDALIGVTVAQAKVTSLQTAQENANNRVKLLSTAATNAQTAAEEMRIAVMERARLSQATLTVYTNNSIIARSREIKAIELQTVALYNHAKAAELSAAATGKAAVAQKGFVASMLALGGTTGVLAVIGVLVYWQYLLIKQSKELTPLQQAQKKVFNDVAEAIADETSALKNYMAIAKNENLSRKMRLDAMNEINKISPQYFGNLSLENIKTQEATEAVKAYTSAMAEQFRLKAVYDNLTELEKNYTKSVMDGSARRIDSVQASWLVQQLFLGNMVYFFKTGLSYSKQLDHFEKINLESRKKEYDQKREWLFEELNNRKKLIQAIEAESAFVTAQVNSLLNSENAYQEALRTTAREKEIAVGNISAAGKTQQEIEKEIAKVTLETEKAVKRSGEVHRNQIYKTIESIDSLLDSTKEQATYQQNRLKNDIQLTQYLEKIRTTTNKKELKELKELYNKRLAYITNDRDESLAAIKKVTENLEYQRSVLENLVGEKVIKIKIDPDLQKIKNDLSDALSILERRKVIFNLTDLDYYQDKLRGITKAMEDYANMNDEEKAPLGDAYINSLMADYTLVTAIIKSLSPEVSKSKKELRSLVDVFNDLSKDISTENIKNTLFDSSYMDKLSSKTSLYKRSLDDVVDTYINRVIENFKDSEGKLTKPIEEILAKVDFNKIFTDGSRQFELKIKYDTLVLATEAIDRMNSEVEQMTNTWNAHLEVQNANQNRLEEANQLLEIAESLLMAYGIQAEKTNSSLTNLGTSLEVIKDVLKELEKVKGVLPEEDIEKFDQFLAILLQLTANLKKAEDVQDFAEKMGMLNEKIKQLGETTELLDAKISILRQKLRMLLNEDTSNFNAEQWKKWKEEILQTNIAIGETQMKLELLGAVQDAIANTFMTLGESIGYAMAGVDNAFSSIIDTLIDVAKRIGQIAIGIGSFLLVISNGAVGWKYIAAGTALVALATYSQAKLQQHREKKAEYAAQMANGGIVPAGYPNDSYPAMLTSGEAVVPPHKLPDFERQPVEVKVTVEGKTKGKDLYYIVKEMERIYQNSY